jgi:hypothetical protein
MKLFQHAIEEARSELGDTYSGSYSYTDVDMLRYAVEGVKEAWVKRPSLKYDPATGRMYPDLRAVLPASTNDDHFPIPLPEEVQPALAYYIVFRCLSRDITDAGNAQVASNAKSRFDQIVMG